MDDNCIGLVPGLFCCRKVGLDTFPYSHTSLLPAIFYLYQVNILPFLESGSLDIPVALFSFHGPLFLHPLFCLFGFFYVLMMRRRPTWSQGSDDRPGRQTQTTDPVVSTGGDGGAFFFVRNHCLSQISDACFFENRRRVLCLSRAMSF